MMSRLPTVDSDDRSSRIEYTRASASIDAIASLVLPASSVLDVGCASGYVAGRIKQLSPATTVIGVEPDAIAAARAAEHCDHVFVGTLDDDAVREALRSHGPFDVVLFADVLEHVADPEQAMSYAADALADAGRIVISVPNVAFIGMRLRLLAGRFNYTDTGLLDRSHLRFFTLRGLIEVLGHSGLRPSLLVGRPPNIGGGRSRRIPLGGVLAGAAGALLTQLAKRWPTMFGYQFTVVARAK